MSDKAVIFFSVSGVTKIAAAKIAKIAGADLIEIEPSEKYKEADVDWRNDKSRASKENADQKIRPSIRNGENSIDKYDTVFIGFPVWWGAEPRVVDSFLEVQNFDGKTVIPFATSGGSSIDDSTKKLKKIVKGKVIWKEGKIITAQESDTDIGKWIRSVE